MSLENLLKEITENTRLANIDVNAKEYRLTKAGMEMAVTSAKSKLADLLADYKDALLTSGVAIFLSGPSEKVTEFVKQSKEMEEGISFVLDAEELYRTMATPVFHSVGNKGTFTIDQTLMIQKQVFDLIQENRLPVRQGIITISDIPPNQGIGSLQDAYDIVRKLVRSVFGDVLNIEHMKHNLTKNALEQKYSGTNVPVLIVNAQQDEIANVGSLFLKGKGQIELTTEDAITPEYVTKQLKSAAKQIKTRKN